MLLVKTTIAPSTIHGIGLFADEFIPQGTRIWEFTPGFDLKLSSTFIENAPEPLQSWLHTHTYCSRLSHQYILWGTHLRRDTVIPQWFQASKAAAASDGHAVHC
jgi:hypothetical protein